MRESTVRRRFPFSEMAEGCRNMAMTGVIVLIVFTLAYMVYESVVLSFLKGQTQMVIPLRKRLDVDNLLFAFLLAVVYVSNYLRGDRGWYNYLLLIVTIIFLYYAFIRSPKIRLKEKGFFYGVIYTAFDAIKNMRLSEDGVLVVETDRRRLLLHFRNVEDLERIYKFFMEH